MVQIVGLSLDVESGMPQADITLENTSTGGVVLSRFQLGTVLGGLVIRHRNGDRSRLLVVEADRDVDPPPLSSDEVRIGAHDSLTVTIKMGGWQADRLVLDQVKSDATAEFALEGRIEYRTESGAYQKYEIRWHGPVKFTQ